MRKSDQAFWQFWQQVKRAERESEAIVVANLMKSMPAAPTAAIAWLERRFPRRWTRAERTQLTGPDGGPIAVESPAARINAEVDRVWRRLSASTEVETDETDAAPVVNRILEESDRVRARLLAASANGRIDPTGTEAREAV